MNSVCTAERPAMSLRAVSIEDCVRAGRKSVMRFSKAGPTANRLLISVIATRPAPISITTTATALLKGLDPVEGLAVEYPAVETVLVILDSLLARRS